MPAVVHFCNLIQFSELNYLYQGASSRACSPILLIKVCASFISITSTSWLQNDHFRSGSRRYFCANAAAQHHKLSPKYTNSPCGRELWAYQFRSRNVLRTSKTIYRKIEYILKVSSLPSCTYWKEEGCWALDGKMQSEYIYVLSSQTPVVTLSLLDSAYTLVIATSRITNRLVAHY